MGVQFIITLALLVGTMYMLHLLILDVSRIFRRPGRALFQSLLRSKRSTPFEEMRALNQKWDKILEYDPLKCVQSLICQVSSGAEPNNTEARQIMNVIGFTYFLVPNQIKRAYDLGKELQNRPDECFKEYPLCIYSAGTMFKVLNWFLSRLT